MIFIFADIVFDAMFRNNHGKVALQSETPTALIIMPFRVNEEVEGILEMASFQPFAPHEIEFLEKLGESVAAAIRNTHINEQTRTLLAKTQQQAEEIRATEEEMRQNMEELTATQ